SPTRRWGEPPPVSQLEADHHLVGRRAGVLEARRVAAWPQADAQGPGFVDGEGHGEHAVGPVAVAGPAVGAADILVVVAQVVAREAHPADAADAHRERRRDGVL